MEKKRKLAAGDWVEICSKEEILTTLDSQGKIDGMLFMPEMFKFCGKRFQVYKRAHKTCDTVFPVRGRRVDRTIHLETRCDGEAHGGCQAGCLIFWKEEWLRPVSDGSQEEVASRIGPRSEDSGRHASPVCGESAVWTQTSASQPDGSVLYACQATQLPYATTELAWWDIRQYFEDFLSGNVGVWRIVCGLSYSGFYNLSRTGIGLGRPMRWLYNKLHRVWGGTLYPRSSGQIPAGQPTPMETLNLQPGELVRVKSHKRILETLNSESRNRGLLWDAEQVPYCGGVYPVLKRVTKIIEENTGKMQEMKTPCIVLDSVVCQSRYSYCRMFCPRAIYSYWREIWLERVEPSVEIRRDL